jgi:nucleotide-binding universal stress UspA family protein
MKILIGFDGSDCSEAALKDLTRAGLPKRVEAIVLSVADVFVPPPVEGEKETSFYMPSGIKKAHEHARETLGKTQKMADEAASRVKAIFPEWEVKAESVADSPAWAVVKRGWEWKPDLIVVGAQGHTVLGGRLILGSVSQRVLYEATSSVRISRDAVGDSASPLRLIVGTDGSANAEAAIESVASRVWPAGTEVRVVVALDTILALGAEDTKASDLRWLEVNNPEDMAQAKRIFEASVEKLRSAGLNVSLIIKKGNPVDVLIKDAKESGSDCIFLGAKGLRGIEKKLLGSVSSAVAAQANCSVEVVRTS